MDTTSEASRQVTTEASSAEGGSIVETRDCQNAQSRPTTDAGKGETSVQDGVAGLSSAGLQTSQAQQTTTGSSMKIPAVPEERDGEFIVGGTYDDPIPSTNAQKARGYVSVGLDRTRRRRMSGLWR